MSRNFVMIFHGAILFTFAVFIYCEPDLRLNVAVSPSCKNLFRSHDVECTLDATLTPEVKITSLTVFACSMHDHECEFDPIVAIDMWKKEPQLSQGINASQINVTGKIGTEGDMISQIKFSWQVETNKDIGWYKCAAHDVELNRRVVTVYKILNCPKKSYLHSMVEELINSTARLEAKMHSIEDLQQSVKMLMSDESEEKTALANLPRSVYLYPNFESSDIFNGKRYHLSKVRTKFNIANANKQCIVFGGHLVEIENRAEFDFVFKFAKLHSHGGHIYTGGNKLASDRVWRFWHTYRPVTYFIWGKGQPDNSGDVELCMELRLDYNAFNDIPCQSEGTFICETKF